MLLLIFVLAELEALMGFQLTPMMGAVGILPLMAGMAVLAATEAEGKKTPWLNAMVLFQCGGGLILIMSSEMYIPKEYIAIYLPAATGELIAWIGWRRSKDPVNPVPEVFRDNIDHTKEVLARALQESQKND